MNIFSEAISAKMIKMTLLAIIKWPIMAQSVANIIFWTEYKYSNIFGSNIWIFLAQIFESFLFEYLNIILDKPSNILQNKEVIKLVFPEYQGHNYATFVKVV